MTIHCGCRCRCFWYFEWIERGRWYEFVTGKIFLNQYSDAWQHISTLYEFSRYIVWLRWLYAKKEANKQKTTSEIINILHGMTGDKLNMDMASENVKQTEANFKNINQTMLRSLGSSSSCRISAVSFFFFSFGTMRPSARRHTHTRAISQMRFNWDYEFASSCEYRLWFGRNRRLE